MVSSAKPPKSVLSPAIADRGLGIKVVHGNRERLVERETARIGYSNPDGVGRVLLEVEEHAVCDGDLARVVESKASAGVVGKVVGKGIPIRVLTRHDTDERAEGAVLIDGQWTARDVVRRLICAEVIVGVRVAHRRAAGCRRTDSSRDVAVLTRRRYPRS